MTQHRKPSRVPDEDLSPGIRRLFSRIRKDVEPDGWSVHVEQSGEHLSFEFRNPLSPIRTGWVFDPGRPTSELRKELDAKIAEEPEFAHTKKAPPPQRTRELLGGIRSAATSYGWSASVFEEVIDTLRHFRVLSNDEWNWLRAVGPDVLPKGLEREWRKRVKLGKQQERKAKRSG